jgi:hypothetical protein
VDHCPILNFCLNGTDLACFSLSSVTLRRATIATAANVLPFKSIFRVYKHTRIHFHQRIGITQLFNHSSALFTVHNTLLFTYRISELLSPPHSSYQYLNANHSRCSMHWALNYHLRNLPVLTFTTACALYISPGKYIRS